MAITTAIQDIIHSFVEVIRSILHAIFSLFEGVLHAAHSFVVSLTELVTSSIHWLFDNIGILFVLGVLVVLYSLYVANSGGARAKVNKAKKKA